MLLMHESGYFFSLSCYPNILNLLFICESRPSNSPESLAISAYTLTLRFSFWRGRERGEGSAGLTCPGLQEASCPLMVHLDTEPPWIINVAGTWTLLILTGKTRPQTDKRDTWLEDEVTSLFLVESAEAGCLVSRPTWVIFTWLFKWATNKKLGKEWESLWMNGRRTRRSERKCRIDTHRCWPCHFLTKTSNTLPLTRKVGSFL
jgi:hypothetical protein